jgi:hypothetical protein
MHSRSVGDLQDSFDSYAMAGHSTEHAGLCQPRPRPRRVAGTVQCTSLTTSHTAATSMN